MSQLALPYWHVDAFADRPFAGNPAAVLLLDAWLPDAALQAIAAETSLPATAFVTPERELRWFNPTREIRLCGHATLACGHVLLGQGGGERITFATRDAGELEVRRAAEGGYEVALPAVPTAPGEWPEAARALVLRLWDKRIAAVEPDARDAKTSLQEWAQARGMAPPVYEEAGRSGPDHAPQFTLRVRLASGETAEATAGSKRVAE